MKSIRCAWTCTRSSRVVHTMGEPIPETSTDKISVFEDFNDPAVREYYKCLLSFDSYMHYFDDFKVPSGFVVKVYLELIREYMLYEVLGKSTGFSIVPHGNREIALIYGKRIKQVKGVSR